MDKKQTEYAIRGLLENEGWKLAMRPKLDAIIASLECKVMEINSKNNRQVFTLSDLYKIMRHYLIEFRDEPHRIMQAEGVEMINDQLEKNVEELINSYQQA